MVDIYLVWVNGSEWPDHLPVKHLVLDRSLRDGAPR